MSVVTQDALSGGGWDQDDLDARALLARLEAHRDAVAAGFSSSAEASEELSRRLQAEFDELRRQVLGLNRSMEAAAAARDVEGRLKVCVYACV